MSTDELRSVLNHPAVFKLRHLTLPLLHHLERDVEEKKPQFQAQAKQLLAVCSRHLTHITVLASQGINFYETDQPDPTHYHPLSYLELEQEDMEEFIGEAAQKSDCYSLMSENTPKGLYLILSTMQRKESEVGDEGTIEIYDFAPLREGGKDTTETSADQENVELTSDWMLTV
jgi:hypothetical protein